MTGSKTRSHTSPATPHALHPVVIRPAAAFWWDPRDDLIRVGDVAGLAVDAVGRVQADALAIGLAWIFDHLVDIRRAEILAGAAEFLHAARVADVRVVNDQVCRPGCPAAISSCPGRDPRRPGAAGR